MIRHVINRSNMRPNHLVFLVTMLVIGLALVVSMILSRFITAAYGRSPSVSESDPRMAIHEHLCYMVECGHYYRSLNRAVWVSYCVRVWQHPTVKKGIPDQVLLVFHSQVTENCYNMKYIVDKEFYRFAYCCISASSIEQMVKIAEHDFGMVEHSTDDVERYWHNYYDDERLDGIVKRACLRGVVSAHAANSSVI